MTKKIVDFPDRRMIKEEAEVWLIRMDGDTQLPVSERREFAEWMDRSPAHREEMLELAQFWEQQNVLTDLVVPLGKPDKRHTAWLRRAPTWGGLATAAAAVILVIGVTYKGWLDSDSPTDTNGLYATVVGQQMETVLTDRSVVQLNTNSQIRVEYSGKYRDIWLLQGEAYFTVAKDAERPFRVYAGNGRVQAVGTAFSVYLKDTGVDVTVTEGRVSLATATASSGAADEDAQVSLTSAGAIGRVHTDFVETNRILRAGQTATIQRETITDSQSSLSIERIVDFSPPELAKRLSWREGTLRFSGDPLHVVVDEISRYTTLSIEISDPEVRSTRIGGRFRVGATDEMFDALEENFGVRVTRVEPNRVLLSAANE